MKTIEAWVWYYWRQGINILPAKHGEKLPWVKSWTEYQTTFTDEKQIKTWLMEGKFQNIFAILGTISNNITEIDVDVPDTDLEDIFSDVDDAKKKLWIAESSMGKKKIYCKGETIGTYNDQVVSDKEYEKPDGKKTKPHVEYMGNNKGTILPPSTHYTGIQYKWLSLDENGELPELETIDTVKLYNNIVQKLRAKYEYTIPKEAKKDGTPRKKRKKRPRYCFIESHDNGDVWKGSLGQDFRTAVACELINCNYTNDEILEFFRTHDEISGEQHNPQLTLDHVERIRRKKLHSWSCPKLQKKCGDIVNRYCDLCPKNKKEDTALYKSTFELPDGKHLEEVIIDGIEKFILYDKKNDTWEIIDDYLYADTPIKPYLIEPDQRDAVILPDGIEEYGSLEELRKEMLEFALKEYDPVDNLDMFKATVILFLGSWISPLWQKNMAEKFIPIVNPRGPSETGKKRYLTIARWLTYHSLYGLKTNRVPTLFRAIAPLKGTLILDEADMGDSTIANELVEFLNSRADGVPIPRYSIDSRKTEWWESFGMTVLATRQGFTDDGLESRCTVMPTATTDNPRGYDLIPPDEWLQKGKQLQRKLLLFRLRHLDGKMPTQLLIPDVSSFRVREALLIVQGLKDEDPELFNNTVKLAEVMQERIIKERAASPEGLMLNIVYEWLTDERTCLEVHGIGYIVVQERETKNDIGERTTYRTPLKLSSISESLRGAFTPSQIAKMWRGMNQDTVFCRINGKRNRGILLIKNLQRLTKIFPKYVPDFEIPKVIELEIKAKQVELEGVNE